MKEDIDLRRRRSQHAAEVAVAFVPFYDQEPESGRPTSGPICLKMGLAWLLAHTESFLAQVPVLLYRIKSGTKEDVFVFFRGVICATGCSTLLRPQSL
jgi:hypothetical protein